MPSKEKPLPRLRTVVLGLVAIAIGGALPAAAHAQDPLILGSTAIPAGAGAFPCFAGGFLAASGSDPSTPYDVPAPGGTITGWSVATRDATTGGPETLLVLRPLPGGGYAVVGVDAQTLPNPLPLGSAHFSVATPIAVQGGELLGLYSTVAVTGCAYSGGAIPSAFTLAGAPTVLPPAVGSTLTPIFSGPSQRLNLAVELTQEQDLSLSGGVAPASAVAGGVAAFSFEVANRGPGAGAISFSDTVPDGLGVLSAVAGGGSCAVAGQQVTCALDGLAAGASTPVTIVVSAPTAGSFANSANVSSSLTDPSPGDARVDATLTVVAPASGGGGGGGATTAPPGGGGGAGAGGGTGAAAVPCTTIALKGATLKLAKRVIAALHCKVGKVTRKASRTVRKGLVISTSPGAGKTLAAGSAVKLTTSSGKPKAKKRKPRTSAR